MYGNSKNQAILTQYDKKADSAQRLEQNWLLFGQKTFNPDNFGHTNRWPDRPFLDRTQQDIWMG